MWAAEIWSSHSSLIHASASEQQRADLRVGTDRHRKSGESCSASFIFLTSHCPASLCITSCQWPLVCSGSNRFWITHLAVLAHLLICVTSSQDCAAEHITALKGGSAKGARPSWIPSFSVPLSWPRSNLPTSDHSVEKLVADIIPFIILFISFGYSGQKVAQAVSVLSGVIVDKMSCNWTNMPNVLHAKGLRVDLRLKLLKEQLTDFIEIQL